MPAKLAYIRRIGVTVLENEILRVSLGADGKAVLTPSMNASSSSSSSSPSFDLLGVPDWSESQKPGPWVPADLPAAAAGRNATRELVVMAHQPRHAPQARRRCICVQTNAHLIYKSMSDFTNFQ